MRFNFVDALVMYKWLASHTGLTFFRCVFAALFQIKLK